MSYLLLSTMAFAQASASFEHDVYLNSLNLEVAPVLVTGCTVEKDFYHEEPTSFALIHFNGETSLIVQSINLHPQTLAVESLTAEGRFWEGGGGMWSMLYERDVWTSLIDTPFTYHDKEFTPSDLQNAFKQKPCTISYKGLDAYTRRDQQPPSP